MHYCIIHYEGTASEVLERDVSSEEKTILKGKRRKRCNECPGCTREDCGTCENCKDMRKFGGLGRKKQCCKQRKCHSVVQSKSQFRELAS